LQNSDKSSDNFINRKIFSKGAVSAVSANLGGRFTRYRIESYLNNSGAEFRNDEIFFGISNQKLDIYSRLVHVSPNTTGRVGSRAILKNKSQALFKGLIKILKEAKNTQSFLSDHSLMLSKEAKSNSIPSLEIETDSVKATHSASTQQIEEDKIFYLMSKGLTEDQARKMIALGFFEPFFRILASKSFRKCVESIIDDKWEGRESSVKLADLSDYSESPKEKRDLFARHYKYR